jgi:hypothetical protein
VVRTVAACPALAATASGAEPDRLARGRELYKQGCQSCHGADGRGNPQWESAVRPIEFSDCGTTAEPTEAWTTVVKKGGAARGLDRAMPAFEGAYNAAAEIPADSAKADPELRYAIGLQRALGPVTTAFTPAIELVGSYNTKTHEHDYAVWGELSKPLNKLGHVIASVGFQAPLRPRDQGWKVEVYLLWDFGDGPLWLGW